MRNENEASAATGMPDHDEGIAVFDQDMRLYYTGLGWDGQLRNAKIYHSPRYADRIVAANPDRRCVLQLVRIEVAG